MPARRRTEPRRWHEFRRERDVIAEERKGMRVARVPS